VGSPYNKLGDPSILTRPIEIRLQFSPIFQPEDGRGKVDIRRKPQVDSKLCAKPPSQVRSLPRRSSLPWSSWLRDRAIQIQRTIAALGFAKRSPAFGGRGSSPRSPEVICSPFSQHGYQAFNARWLSSQPTSFAYLPVDSPLSSASKKVSREA